MNLLENPFHILGASIRDGKNRLMELSDELSFNDESGNIDEARANLTNPGKRIYCEVSWLVGISPKQVKVLIDTLKNNPDTIFTLLQEGSFPALTASNALASGMLQLASTTNGKYLSQWIIGLAKFHDEIKIEEVMITLNEEREISRFSVINDTLRIEDALTELRNYYKQVIKSALNKLPPSELVIAVTEAIENTTNIGLYQAPLIIDEMVDSFEVEAQQFLEKETNNVKVLVRRIKEATQVEQGSESIISELVDQLEKVLKNWDIVAQPMQVSSRSKGLTHELSHEVGAIVRDLSIDLFNNHDFLEISKRITQLQQEVFAEVDLILEQSKTDEDALDEIVRERESYLNKAKENAEDWARDITYETKIGIIFKKDLKISPDGVEYNGKKFALSEITGVRWGGTIKSTNGTTTEIEYSIYIHTPQNNISIDTKNENLYSNFTERLWKAVGARLFTQFLEGVKDGSCFSFGSAEICDNGVKLTRNKLFGSEEEFFYWSQVQALSRSGAYLIMSVKDPRFNVELDYQHMDNIHMLSVAVGLLKENNLDTLSGLL